MEDPRPEYRDQPSSATAWVSCTVVADVGRDKTPDNRGGSPQTSRPRNTVSDHDEVLNMRIPLGLPLSFTGSRPQLDSSPTEPF